MHCKNCNGELRIVDGLCVRCRLLGPDSSVSSKKSGLYNSLPVGSKLFLALPLCGALLLFLAIGSKYDFLDLFWQKRTPTGVIAPEDPQQINGNFKPWNYKGYLIRPLASYKIEARVLAKSNYWFSPGAELAPIDLTLGWGPMSDQKILDQLTIGSGNRSYYWSAALPPISPDQINRHAANTHIVPKDGKIFGLLKTVSVSDIVRLSGYLIEISRADGWNWTSSMTRNDSGGGACELMWVDQADRLNRD